MTINSDDIYKRLKTLFETDTFYSPNKAEIKKLIEVTYRNGHNDGYELATEDFYEEG